MKYNKKAIRQSINDEIYNEWHRAVDCAGFLFAAIVKIYVGLVHTIMYPIQETQKGFAL